jgi:cyclophilin family peptidyl-prolyl cis-trans isomerase
MCKNAPNKKLHYIECPIHRIVSGFVAQGGDVTRGDGSGGEVGVMPQSSYIFISGIANPVV